MNDSLAALLASQNPQKLIEIINNELTDEQVLALQFDWNFWARASQLPPKTQWTVWNIITGRGWGKTRTGAETVRRKVEFGEASSIALVGATAADVRDVMVDGESGLLNISPPWFRPEYVPSKRRLTWPNGARAYTYSALEPERLRGPQHGLAWCDELAAWRYADLTWDNLMFGLRKDPAQVIVTTTPRPTKLIKELIQNEDDGTVVTTGTTYDNLYNLSPVYRQKIVAKYEGTRTGRQELKGELLLDTPGALWSYELLDAYRVQEAPKNLLKCVVAIDPAVTNTEDSDETGIVIVGTAWCSCKGLPEEHGFVLDDYTIHASPPEWADHALRAFNDYKADGIVAETNNGGDLVENVLQSRPNGKRVPFKKVHASRNKITRAEPVASQYERGLWHHVGTFAALEDQMCSYTQGDRESPDRMDALVWGAQAVMPTTPVQAHGRVTMYTPVKIGPQI